MNGVDRDGGGRVTLRIFDSLKPVIAAVNGPAVGIGVTMQLAMDIRLASTAARFGFVFAKRGITPEAASSWFLPRLVGIQTALEWCYTGRVLPSARGSREGPRPLAPRTGRPAARSPCFGAGDHRQHRASIRRPDPPDDLAHGRRRSSDDGAPGRQSRHSGQGRVRRRQRRCRVLFGETRRGLSQSGLARCSGHLASLAKPRICLTNARIVRRRFRTKAFSRLPSTSVNQ